MYVKYYKFAGRPFQLTPDPRFYFESATHRKAMSYLGYGLAQGEGFIVITGDIGAGKTTLVGHLMDTIDPRRLSAVKIAASEMDGDTALRLAAHAFGIETDGADKAQVLSRIEAFMHSQARAGKRSLLIVDEAQMLDIEALEALRMLSNFQLGGQPLVQIFLLGQPEFREALAGTPALEQLRQRIIAMHHLAPMQPQEVQPYIEHRLKLVGWTGTPCFEPDAYARLAEESRGVPRLVNALAQAAMQRAADAEANVIDVAIVEAVCRERQEAAAAIAPAPTPSPEPEARDGAQKESIRAVVHSLKASLNHTEALALETGATGDAAQAISQERIAMIEGRLKMIEARLEEQDKALAEIVARMDALAERTEESRIVAA